MTPERGHAVVVDARARYGISSGLPSRAGARQREARGMRHALVRSSVVALVSALALSGLGAVLPAQATVGGPTCNVPADYGTIGGALADAGCTTINVAAGTYPAANLVLS